VIFITKNIRQYSITISVVINPIAIPETGRIIWIPASINDNVPAQTVAIEEEPLDSNTSDTTRIVRDNQQESYFFNAL
jgi:hypothetical protein